MSDELQRSHEFTRARIAELEELRRKNSKLLAENKELKSAQEFDSARAGVLARLVGANYPDNKAVQLGCIGTILGGVRVEMELVIKQRDELLAALEGVAAFWDSITTEDCLNDLHAKARAAIASVKGGAA